MKKASLCGLLVAASVVGSTTLSVQAANADNLSYEKTGKNTYIVTGGQICSPEALKDILEGLCDKLPNIPEAEKPETEKPEKPETEKPEKPEAEKPETEKPEAEELSFAEQVAELVNAERTKAGLNPVTLDTEITSAALVRAKEIERSFSHTRPDGRGFSSVLTDSGIKFNGAGENIAWGQRSPKEVMQGWMNSEGHRANILNPKFTKIGVGHYQNTAGRNHWVQIFTH